MTNWLLRQLASQDVPSDLVITVHWDQRKLSTQARIRELRENIDVLLRDSYGQMLPREVSPRSFSLDRTIRLPTGKGRSTAPVLEGIAQTVEDFYKHVVEGLRPHVPRPPKLSQEKPRSGLEINATTGKEDKSETLEPAQPVIDLEDLGYRDMPPDDDVTKAG